MAAVDYLTPSDWLDSLEVGGPYDIPRGMAPATVRAATAKPRFEAKRFTVQKPSSFKQAVVHRIDSGDAPAIQPGTEKVKPVISKYRRFKNAPPVERKRAPGIDERIMSLNVNGTLSLAKNQYGIRERAAIISKNTGRQFTVDMVDGGKVLTRRG